MSFMVGTLVFGGDAGNGFIEGGRYFFDDKGHVHEVSRAVFNYSTWHIYGLFFFGPLAMLCAWYLIVTRKKGTWADRFLSRSR
jgi:hypothetical protein